MKRGAQAGVPNVRIAQVGVVRFALHPDRLWSVRFSEQGEALPGVPKLRTRSLGWVLSALHVRHRLMPSFAIGGP